MLNERPRVQATGVVRADHPQILPSNDSKPDRTQVKKVSDKGLKRDAIMFEKKLQ